MEKIWIKNGKFTELNDTEIASLADNADALSVYIKELNEFRIEKLEISLIEKLKGKVSETEFKAVTDRLAELNEKEQVNIELKIKELGEMLENFNRKAIEAINETELKGLSNFEISLKRTKVNDSDLSTTLNKFKKGDKFSFNIKADFASSDVSTIIGNAGGQIIPGIGQIATPKLVLSNFFKVSPIQIDGNGVATYEDWDETTTVSAAAAVAEGAAFPASTAKFKTYSINIEKIGDTIGMTYESLRDFKRFSAELARFLTRNMQAVVNQALWNGTGVTPNIAGIYTRVTAFDPVTYSGATTTDPDIVDLARVLSTEIMNGKDAKYETNFMFVSHNDYLSASLKKDTTNRLIYPNGLPKIGMVEIIPSSFVVDNTAVIGDKNYVELIGNPNEIQIEVGFKTGDWESDKESLKGRVRTALLIREADKDGFLKVTSISAALTAITTV